MIELGIFLILLVLGFTSGQLIEKSHFTSIIKRENQLINVPVVTLKTYQPLENNVDSQLVTGNVVVSIDFFKKFLSGLKNIFGGRLTSYESLLDRARREAILRMKEQAIDLGAEVIINTRVETSSISKGSANNDSIGSVEVLAYGTALIPKQNSNSSVTP